MYHLLISFILVFSIGSILHAQDGKAGSGGGEPYAIEFIQLGRKYQDSLEKYPMPSDPQYYDKVKKILDRIKLSLDHPEKTGGKALLSFPEDLFVLIADGVEKPGRFNREDGSIQIDYKKWYDHKNDPIWKYTMVQFEIDGLAGTQDRYANLVTGLDPDTIKIYIPNFEANQGKGILWVDGMPGRYQSANIIIRPCSQDLNNGIANFSCDYTKHINGRIGSQIQLNAGVYRLDLNFENSDFYAGSISYVRVFAERSTRVPLTKIEFLNDSSSNVGVNLFWDLSDQRMRDFFLNDVVNLSEGKNPNLQYTKDRFYFENEYYRQNQVGYLIRLEVARINKKGYIAYPGDFVSVFPGVYGVEYTDINTGNKIVQKGIVVKEKEIKIKFKNPIYKEIN